MFELDHVSKSYGETEVLKDLSVAVEPGKTTVFIGPSGCGKSTCLRLLIGLIEPDRGQVRLDGEPIRADTVRTLRRRIGYVIQDGGLFPHLTAEQNITLMARELGIAQPEQDERVATLAELTDFPRDGLTRYPLELSGGQRQRVALMRALMLDPEALLLDEPLGALDPMIRYDLQRDLRRIFRQLGKTVVLVTHDLAEADYFGDEIVLMRAGTIVQRGSLQAMSDEPKTEFVTRFIRAQRGHALAQDDATSL
ncbi:MAG: ATP-binding cassette domain-containing protein [Haliangiales bacterium]